MFDFDLNSRTYLLRTRCWIQTTRKGIFNLSQIYHVVNDEKPGTVCDVKARPQNPQKDLVSIMSGLRAYSCFGSEVTLPRFCVGIIAAAS